MIDKTKIAESIKYRLLLPVDGVFASSNKWGMKTVNHNELQEIVPKLKGYENELAASQICKDVNAALEFAPEVMGLFASRPSVIEITNKYDHQKWIVKFPHRYRFVPSDMGKKLGAGYEGDTLILSSVGANTNALGALAQTGSYHETHDREKRILGNPAVKMLAQAISEYPKQMTGNPHAYSLITSDIFRAIVIAKNLPHNNNNFVKDLIRLYPGGHIEGFERIKIDSYSMIAQESFNFYASLYYSTDRRNDIIFNSFFETVADYVLKTANADITQEEKKDKMQVLTEFLARNPVELAREFNQEELADVFIKLVMYEKDLGGHESREVIRIMEREYKPFLEKLVQEVEKEYKRRNGIIEPEPALKIEEESAVSPPEEKPPVKPFVEMLRLAAQILMGR